MRAAIVTLVLLVLLFATAGVAMVSGTRLRALPAAEAALAGTSYEAALTQSFVERARRGRSERGVSWVWRECVTSTHVRSAPLPGGPISRMTARQDLLDAWSSAGLSVNPAKDLYDLVLSPKTTHATFRVMPLAEDAPGNVEPFESELVQANPARLLVIAVEENCPDPDPWWKDRARAVVRLIR